MRYLTLMMVLLSAFAFGQERLFTVDDYPVTDGMIRSNYKGAMNAMQEGDVLSLEKSWFTDETTAEVLVFQLATDNHRLLTWHFYADDIPTDLSDTFEMHVDGGELATKKQVRESIPKFIKLAKEIPARYFISIKGLKLGIKKKKALELYKSKPTSITAKDGIEKYEWSFEGDLSIANGFSKDDGGPIARDSFGHTVTLFFKKDRLIGIILFNDIP